MARIVCFGEILLRLTAPGRELLLQTPRFEANVGGAEANVAVGLAKLGHDSVMVSVLPGNALGDAARGELRRHGVDVTAVTEGPGRLGLYFLAPGAGLRASEIVYDRTYSAFAQAPVDLIDWAPLLDGADLLHLSGITPALGPVSAAAGARAVDAANAAGVPVSFDGNYRASLWDSWDSDPRSALTRLIAGADILFGNHRDISLLLGRSFSGEDSGRRREAADAVFAAFPRLRHVASTSRHVDDADRHRIAARLDAPGGQWQTEEIVVAGIVDRIGAGDAFAVGLLHALLSGSGEADAVRSGLALTCLKHSLPGDASLFGQRDIDGFLAGELDVRR